MDQLRRFPVCSKRFERTRNETASPVRAVRKLHNRPGTAPEQKGAIHLQNSLIWRQMMIASTIIDGDMRTSVKLAAVGLPMGV